MADLKTAIGLMSGTSMDGIDIALVRTDGEGVVERFERIHLRTSDEVSDRKRAVIEAFTRSQPGTGVPSRRR